MQDEKKKSYTGVALVVGIIIGILGVVATNNHASKQGAQVATLLSRDALQQACKQSDKRACDAQEYFAHICWLANDYLTLHICLEDNYAVDKGLWDSSQPDIPNAKMRAALLAGILPQQPAQPPPAPSQSQVAPKK